jgi:hypothetical protein
MGIREQINEKPAVATGITAGVLFLSLLFMLYQLGFFSSGPSVAEVWYWEGGDEYRVGELTEMYEDDSASLIRAHRYVFEEGGEPFVLYLSRVARDGSSEEYGGYDFLEVRTSADPTWIPMDSEAGYQITTPPVGPNGGRAIEFTPDD